MTFRARVRGVGKVGGKIKMFSSSTTNGGERKYL